MDAGVQTVCIYLGATAALVSIAANSIKIGEWTAPRIGAFLKKVKSFPVRHTGQALQQNACSISCPYV
jgi:hypothetical protein